MSCDGCPGANKKVDKHGNPVVGKNEMGEEEIKRHADALQSARARQEARDMSYSDYLTMKKNNQAESRRIGKETIATFSDDYKRIQIDGLISVYNHEEVNFNLTPTQALVALYEFVHDPGYQKIVKEFDGLAEQVDKKYKELKEDRIDVEWKP